MAAETLAHEVHPILDRALQNIGDAEKVVQACHGEAATIDQLLSRTGLATAAVSAALRELERVGAVSRRNGRIWPM